MDAYGNVIDPTELASTPASVASKHSSVDSDTESNVSKGAGQKAGGKKKKKNKKKKGDDNGLDEHGAAKDNYNMAAYAYAMGAGGAAPSNGEWKLAEPRESNLSHKEQRHYLGLMEKFAGYTNAQDLKNVQGTQSAVTLDFTKGNWRAGFSKAAKFCVWK